MNRRGSKQVVMGNNYQKCLQNEHNLELFVSFWLYLISLSKFYLFHVHILSHKVQIIILIESFT